jgi:meromycolic acid enoyl-[acyl-carrier-protein] reductase
VDGPASGGGDGSLDYAPYRRVLKGGNVGEMLAGKKILVTGVLDRRSIAYSAARLAQAEGAEIALSGFGRVMRLTERTAKRLDPVPPVLELDVNKPEDIEAVAADLGDRWGELDGIVHAIAFAPEDALGGNFLTAEWPSVATALQTSAYSLKALTVGLSDLMKPGSSVVGLDFDARIAWPSYDWMGVAKAALESTSRYLARDLGDRGIRVNLVSAGPIKTLAAKGISGFESIEGEWNRQAPLRWDTTDPEPVGRAVVSLLSDWWPATTGELIHVDGGYHAVGAPIR